MQCAESAAAELADAAMTRAVASGEQPDADVAGRACLRLWANADAECVDEMIC
jgi:hypothetical protein